MKSFSYSNIRLFISLILTIAFFSLNAFFPDVGIKLSSGEVIFIYTILFITQFYIAVFLLYAFIIRRHLPCLIPLIVVFFISSIYHLIVALNNAEITLPFNSDTSLTNAALELNLVRIACCYTLFLMSLLMFINKNKQINELSIVFVMIIFLFSISFFLSQNPLGYILMTILENNKAWSLIIMLWFFMTLASVFFNGFKSNVLKILLVMINISFTLRVFSVVSFEHSFGKVWNIGVIFEPCISIMAFLFFNYIVFKGFVMAEKKNALLSKDIFIDQLTRAHNRKFLDSIEGDTKFIKDNSPIGVVVVDIDFFKNINDSYGHKFGDYVLKTISFTIQQNIRSNDHLIRLGGEEFLIILTNSEHQKTIQITERLHNEIRAMSFKNSGVHTVNITVSMGVYTIKNTNENIIDAIDKGDIALYASKRNGRNMTSIYGV